MPGYWLMKTEPDVFSFDDLLKSKGKVTCWEGVRNYQARNIMRDEMKKGDKVFVYHSRLADPCIMGVAEVVQEGYADNTALDKKNKYYDERAAKKGESPWVMVDIKALQKFDKPVPRSLLKEQKALKDMVVLSKGSRLSVQPVRETEYKLICELGKPKKV